MKNKVESDMSGQGARLSIKMDYGCMDAWMDEIDFDYASSQCESGGFDGLCNLGYWSSSGSYINPLAEHGENMI